MRRNGLVKTLNSSIRLESGEYRDISFREETVIRVFKWGCTPLESEDNGNAEPGVHEQAGGTPSPATGAICT